jgi:oxalate decarboxylase
MKLSRRSVLSATAGALVTTAAVAHGQTSGIPQPRRPGGGGTDPSPRNLPRDLQNPDILVPPTTDRGTLPNLRFSFSDSHTRIASGGWTRQVTVRELPASTAIAGVQMRLNAGAIREMHWHKAAEWAYMLYGSARITAIDQAGRNFVDDVGVGDLWFFDSGMPHSIQGLGPDGCEFLLVFDDGSFDEDNTFLLSDWLKRTPKEVLAKNFGMPASTFDRLRDPADLYIFASQAPGPLGADKLRGAEPVPNSFKHRMMAQTPIQMKGGAVRITDSSVFKASKSIAAALVEVNPGAMRELHWHPNADEWQYFIEGKGRMTVFAGQGQSRTFDYQAGDVGYVPFGMGHYVENTGEKPLRFLEMFKSSYFADLSLEQWLALTPPSLLDAHLGWDRGTIESLRKNKVPIVPVE